MEHIDKFQMLDISIQTLKHKSLCGLSGSHIRFCLWFVMTNHQTWWGRHSAFLRMPWFIFQNLLQGCILPAQVWATYGYMFVAYHKRYSHTDRESMHSAKWILPNAKVKRSCHKSLHSSKVSMRGIGNVLVNDYGANASLRGGSIWFVAAKVKNT